ncbi:MAG: hypothetical protein HKM93_09045 [Desulfobacteraceae bacterium]|nr:hypothetical protein [Desulfobacteraceae bacterium]
MKWRKWNNIIHRDIGYLCAGLTLIYAISGVAVNHMADWNPNYRIERVTAKVDALQTGEQPGMPYVQQVLAQLAEERKFKNVFQPDPKTLNIFVEGNTITVDLPTGQVIQEKTIPRPVLYEMNFLHTNHAKKLWTWFADLYAVALGVLTVTGLFVLKGNKGLTGRGKWLTGIGVAVPVIFLIAYLW